MNRTFAATISVLIASSLAGGCDSTNLDPAQLREVDRHAKAFDGSVEVGEVLRKNAPPTIFAGADRVVVVRPYADLAKIRLDDIEGIRSIESPISSSDGINLLVFVQNDTNRILGWANVPRNVIDFQTDDSSLTVNVEAPHRNWSEALKAKSHSSMK